MSELPRSDQDTSFARGLAAEYRGEFLELNRRVDVSTDKGARNLLSSLELRVAHHIDGPPSFLPASLRRFLEDQISLARRLLARDEGVLMLREAGNGFGLDVIGDVFNGSARSALSRWGQRGPEYPDDGPAVPPSSRPALTTNWLDDVQRGPAPVRRVDEQEASASFLTLFSDALRISATAQSSANSNPIYTANCNLKGWTLEVWPQFNYSPTRFGSVVTWPVTDRLLTSGNYMFQGLKGGFVRNDSTPHYLGPSRTKPVVNL